MTAVQDQSRADFERELIANRQFKPSDFCFTDGAYTGDDDVQFAWDVWQAARALPAGMEPVAWVDLQEWPPIRWPSGTTRADYYPIDGAALYTATQVLAMLAHRGRGDDANTAQTRMDAGSDRGHGLHPNWQAVPVESTPEMKAAGRRALKGAAGCSSAGQAVVVFDAMLAAAPRPPAAQERAYICPTSTVADLVNNLLLLDQALPIYGAQYIEHPPGKRRAIAIHPTVSRERVKDERWIGEGDELNAAVIWTRAEQPAAPTTCGPGSAMSGAQPAMSGAQAVTTGAAQASSASWYFHQEYFDKTLHARAPDGRQYNVEERKDPDAVKLIFAMAKSLTKLQRTPLTPERIHQIDDETHFHEAPDWPVRFGRALEAAHDIK